MYRASCPLSLNTPLVTYSFFKLLSQNSFLLFILKRTKFAINKGKGFWESNLKKGYFIHERKVQEECLVIMDKTSHTCHFTPLNKKVLWIRTNCLISLSTRACILISLNYKLSIYKGICSYSLL